MFGSDFLSRLNQIADMNSYSLTGDAAELIGNDQEFLSEVNTVSAKHGINPAHLLGLIASESGFNPKAQNPAAGVLAAWWRCTRTQHGPCCPRCSHRQCRSCK